MVRAYWEIGREIVEDEQQGEQRAEYGKALIENLARELTAQHGKGFDRLNLSNMRGFYLAWTHCRQLKRRVSCLNATYWLSSTLPANAQSYKVC